jgi:hypothetical protein
MAAWKFDPIEWLQALPIYESFRPAPKELIKRTVYR